MFIFVVVFVIIVVFVVLAATVSAVVVTAIILGIVETGPISVETGPVGVFWCWCFGGVGFDGRIDFDLTSFGVETVDVYFVITGTIEDSFHLIGAFDNVHAVDVNILVVFVAFCSIVECAFAVVDTAYT